VGGGLEAEGAPSVIEAMRFCEVIQPGWRIEAVWVGDTPDVVCSTIRRVSRLHPGDVLWDAGLRDEGEAAHASAEASIRD
jgi:hypothetical protein